MFFKGQKFCSLEELNLAIKIYEETYFCKIVKRDCRKLNSAAKRVPKQVEITNPSLIYCSMHFVCKFSGNPRNTNNVIIRKTKSFWKSYPFSISLQVSEDGKSLNVVTFEPQHSHAFCEQTYKYLPRQKASNLETLEQVKRDLQIQG